MILFTLALLAVSAPDSVAPTPTPVVVTAPPSTSKPTDDIDKVVCHVDVETGTRLGTHKECHTRREWAQMQSDETNYLGQQTALSHPH